MTNPLPPNATIGILGGGQLGRMAALAAANLGYRCHIFTPEADAPASQVSAVTTQADFTDMVALEQFARSVDVITLEFENVPVEAVERIAAITPVRPGADILRIAQHRAREKTMASDYGINPVPWAAVTSLDELRAAIADIGLPGVIKTARLGYDGKGQVTVRDMADLESAWASLKTDDAVYEKLVNLKSEIPVIVARDLSGHTVAYPPGENVHRNHILAETKVPASISQELQIAAIESAQKIASSLDYVGVMGAEFFITDTDELIFNEIAPRPHNSGHWTMDAAITSQFEQQIRAVCGLPLGPVDLRCPVVMENLLGDTTERAKVATADPRGKLHLYGKAEAREGRKMGHINWLDSAEIPA